LDCHALQATFAGCLIDEKPPQSGHFTSQYSPPQNQPFKAPVSAGIPNTTTYYRKEIIMNHTIRGPPEQAPSTNQLI